MAIWNLGSINIDYIYQLPHLPRPGETLAANGFAIGLGGKGANQSVAAAKAGAETRHLGAMGTGDDWVVDQLREADVNTDDLRRLADHSTGHAIILLDKDAENSIVIHPGANRALEIEDLQQRMAAIKPNDTLLIQNETNCQAAAAQIAKAAGARVIYSAAPFDLEAVAEVMPQASILAMNTGESEQFFAAYPNEIPVEGILITHGARGAEYRDLESGKTYKQSAFPVEPIDTTGAGDTFAGYFAAGLDRGEDVQTALRLASAAAALKVTRPGAGGAIPSLQEVETFLREAEAAS